MTKRWGVINEMDVLQTGGRGFKTKKEAETIKTVILNARSPRNQRAINQEFGRSLNLRVVKYDK